MGICWLLDAITRLHFAFEVQLYNYIRVVKLEKPKLTLQLSDGNLKTAKNASFFQKIE